MPIFREDPTERQLMLEELPVSKRQALAAVIAGSSLRNQLTSISRAQELRFVQGKGSLLNIGADISLDLVREVLDISAPEPPKISAADANAQGNAYGLQFEKPITIDELRIKIDRKRKEVAIDSTLERSSGGLFFGSVKLAADFLTQASDPVNVVSAFIPITRSIKWLQSAAISRRALKGTLEGLAGASLVEPVILGAAKQEQADYGFLNSLMNVTFGGILGGGLHVGTGKIGDIYRKRAKLRKVAQEGADAITGRPVDDVVPINRIDEPQTSTEARAKAIDDMTVPERVTGTKLDTRVDATKIAIAQAEQGRTVDVDARLQHDPAYRDPTLTPEQVAAATGPESAKVQAEATKQANRINDEMTRTSVDEGLSKKLDDELENENIRTEEPAEAERMANEAEEDLKQFAESLTDDEKALLKRLDDDLIEATKDPNVDFVTAKTIEEIVPTAQRQKSFLQKLGDCVLRNP